MARILLAVLLAAAPLAAQPPAPNPQIDYAGFERLTGEVRAWRAARLVDHHAFRAKAAEPGTLVLDARSREAFAAGHIEGAVNLPFTDFTEESLAATIGPDRERPILIYCNNNFSNDAPPVQRKLIQVALNIQTFINLYGYGYRNVWELNEVVDFNDPAVRWTRGRAAG